MANFDPATAWTAALPGAPELPRFGRLCSRIAKAMGIDELAFASKAQKSWIHAARRIFPAMASFGAPDIDHRFLAHDERPFFRMMDLALGSPLEAATRCDDTAAGMALFTYEAPDGSSASLRVATSLESRQTKPMVTELEAAFGSANSARCFALAHEFGHAWQDSLGHRHLFSGAAIQVGTTFALECARIAQEECSERLDMQPDRRESGSSPILEERFDARAQCMEAFEEAACDAIGCWALAKTGEAGPLAKAQAYRAQSGLQGAAASRGTGWLLRSLCERDLAQDFSGFTRIMESAIQRLAPQVFAAFELEAQAEEKNASSSLFNPRRLR